MWLRFRRSLAGEELSEQVKESLATQFSLDSSMVDKLRFSSKRGRFCDRLVKFIRIFDPALVQGGKSDAPSYEDLAQAPGNRRALLFEGHVEKRRAGLLH